MPPSDPAPHHEDFQNHLEKVKRRNWRGQAFYSPNDIKTWMNATSSRGTYSNIVGLLAEGGQREKGLPQLLAAHCSNYLLVLAILLHPIVNSQSLFRIFRHCNISDKIINLTNIDTYYASVAAEVREQWLDVDAQVVVVAFEKVRWQFCPLSLELNTVTTFEIDSIILPFCHGYRVNKKGGISGVHHYKVQEDLIDCKDFKEALKDFKHYTEDFGWCFEFAVKTYYPAWNDVYRFQIRGLVALSNRIGVVRYLGEYHIRPKEETGTEHSIILEYGRQDLDEYLADPDEAHPIFQADIISFWESIFEIAETIRGLHELEYRSEDGSYQIYQGYHGNITPDSILRIGDEFKLANIGMAIYAKLDAGNTGKFIQASANSYSAPELDYRRFGVIDRPLQTIDSWSFGCILSSVATWVILGAQAYDDYFQIRKQAITRLEEEEIFRGEMNYYAFHNGKKVLSAVLEWHQKLRESSRDYDPISPRVLELVEEKMLLERPEDRIDFQHLCMELREVLRSARGEKNAAQEPIENSNSIAESDPSKPAISQEETRDMDFPPTFTPNAERSGNIGKRIMDWQKFRGQVP